MLMNTWYGIRFTGLLVCLVAAAACSGVVTQAPARAVPSFAAPPTFKIAPAADWVSPEREAEMDQTIPAYNPFTAGPADQIKAQFRGKDRRVAKISVADGGLEPFGSLDALVQSLPSDSAMLSHDPKIARTSTSDRVEEERHNVQILAWIYAIKYEDDQDWHIIAGTDPADATKTFFNCEVSGLPPTSASDYASLLNVRNELDTILQHQLPGPGSYQTYYDDPISVTIEGSLFYDVDHAPGVVGPPEAKPASAWEIHPITDLRPR